MLVPELNVCGQMIPFYIFPPTAIITSAVTTPEAFRLGSEDSAIKLTQILIRKKTEIKCPHKR